MSLQRISQRASKGYENNSQDPAETDTKKSSLSAVLIIGFKRIDSLRKVLEATLGLEHGIFYVALDGARSPNEKAECDAVRSLVLSYAEQTPIEILAAESNLGCGICIESAISEVLRVHDDVIVLEDDCVPSPAFFGFCRTMLDVLRNDERVMHISGNRFFAPEAALAGEVTFSKYPHAWGWATWRRAWRHYTRAGTQLSQDSAHGLIESLCPESEERQYWLTITEDLANGRSDIWDYYWMLAIWRQGGVAVLPPQNLVTNIGFDSFATHTSGGSISLSIPSVSDLGPVGVPDHRRRDRLVERRTFSQNMYSGDPPDTRPIWKRALRRLREAIAALEAL